MTDLVNASMMGLYDGLPVGLVGELLENWPSGDWRSPIRQPGTVLGALPPQAASILGVRPASRDRGHQRHGRRPAGWKLYRRLHHGHRRLQRHGEHPDRQTGGPFPLLSSLPCPHLAIYATTAGGFARLVLRAILPGDEPRPSTATIWAASSTPEGRRRSASIPF